MEKLNMEDKYWKVINNRADHEVDETQANEENVFKAPYIVQKGWIYNYQLQYFEMPPVPAGYVYDWGTNSIIKAVGDTNEEVLNKLNQQQKTLDQLILSSL